MFIGLSKRFTTHIFKVFVVLFTVSTIQECSFIMFNISHCGNAPEDEVICLETSSVRHLITTSWYSWYCMTNSLSYFTMVRIKINACLGSVIQWDNLQWRWFWYNMVIRGSTENAIKYIFSQLIHPLWNSKRIHKCRYIQKVCYAVNIR